MKIVSGKGVNWHRDTDTGVLVPVRQPWPIWVDELRESTKNYSISKTKQSTIKRAYIYVIIILPDRKVQGAIMGPIWGRQDPDGSHVGPMNFAIWAVITRAYNPITARQMYHS